MQKFSIGQTVKVQQSHNQFKPTDTAYTIGAINKVNSYYMVNLLLEGKSVGTVPQEKLKS